MTWRRRRSGRGRVVQGVWSSLIVDGIALISVRLGWVVLGIARRSVILIVLPDVCISLKWQFSDI